MSLATMAIGTIRAGQVVDDRFVPRRPYQSSDRNQVWEAVDQTTGDVVVIKRPTPEGAEDPEAFNRLRREVAIALMARRLQWPRVARAVEPVLTPSGTGVFEVVPGQTLAQILAQRIRIPAPEALSIMIQLGLTLEMIHTAGIVHRDVKLSNLIWNPDETTGKWKLTLLDFDVAEQNGTASKVLTDAADRCGADIGSTISIGPFIGTIDYASPEAVRGARCTIHNDLFAAGVVFYQLVTGRLPFGTGPTDDKVYRIARGQADRILEPNVQVMVSSLIETAIAHRPTDRFGSAAELVGAIRDVARYI